MKIIVNERLVRRNTRIGQYTTIIALLVLLAGMVISFQRPDLFWIALGALVVGFILSQVGMYYGNRWGRSPRPYEQISAGLKGLPGEYTLYHYMTPAAHLLIGPAGAWVLLAQYQKGKIRWDGRRWRQSGGGFVAGYMRLFGQDSIGRPEYEAAEEVRALKKYLAKRDVAEDQIPPIQAALVFTEDKVELDADNAPIPALPVKKLKEFIRRQAREKPMPALEIQRVNGWFGE